MGCGGEGGFMSGPFLKSASERSYTGDTERGIKSSSLPTQHEIGV